MTSTWSSSDICFRVIEVHTETDSDEALVKVPVTVAAESIALAETTASTVEATATLAAPAP